MITASQTGGTRIVVTGAKGATGDVTPTLLAARDAAVQAGSNASAARDAAVAANTTAQAAAATATTAAQASVDGALPADRNIFDKQTAAYGSVVKTSDGSVIAVGGYAACGPMRVEPGGFFTSNADLFGTGDANGGNGFGMFFYIDKAKTQPVAGSGQPGGPAGTVFQVPATANYVQFSVQGDASTVSAIHIVNGANPPGDYRAFDFADSATAVRLAAARARRTAVVKQEFFDPAAIQADKLLFANGNIITQPGNGITGLIPVTPGGQVVVNLTFVPGNPNFGWNWYGAGGVRNGSTPGGFTANVGTPVPKTAFYGAVSFDMAMLYQLSITDSPVAIGDRVVGLDDAYRMRPFAGRRAYAIGDSKVVAGAAGGSYPAGPLGAYVEYIARELRLGAYASYAVSGSRTHELLTGGPGSPGPIRGAADFANADLIVSSSGTNSFGIRDPNNNNFPAQNSRPLGVLGDTGAAGTFYGDLYDVHVAKLQTWCPRARIILCAPQQRFDDVLNGAATGVPGNPRNMGDSAGGPPRYLSDYVDAVVAFAKAASMPVFNQFAELGINLGNFGTYFVDGLHEGLLGYQEKTVPAVTAFIERHPIKPQRAAA